MPRYAFKENWREAPGFPLYEVSDLGRIRRISTKRLLTPHNAEISLRRNGKSIHTQLGRLILEAFVGSPATPDLKARHLNDDRKNSTLSNLAWGTQKENVQAHRESIKRSWIKRRERMHQ